MQPVDYPVRPKVLNHLWFTFMHTGQLSPAELNLLDPAILQSWRRCAPRFNPNDTPRPKQLKGPALQAVLNAQADLMTVATPHMEDIHQFIEGSDSAILLADGSGALLAIEGDMTAIEAILSLGLGPGAYWSEGQLGTNALGLVLINALPTQVVGAEHYFRAYHHLTTTAAPIHDVNGRITGLIAVVGPAATATSHTLGLLMSAARAIGGQLQTDWFVVEANYRLSELNTILGAISEGVIAWNAAGKVTHVNQQAGAILGLQPRSVLGRPLDEALHLPEPIMEAMRGNGDLRDVEVSFAQALGTAVVCLVNLRPVLDGAVRPAGHIAMLRPIEQVRRLVQQQVGAQAILTLDDISAQSLAMRQVLRQARIAARGTAPVLIRGEAGVGKNHLARVLHNDSERRDRPFLAINCRAIPHELMAGELLGYEKDGTRQGRPSKFELASGGTLLLDQIESLSLEVQAALLQLLETGHIMRPGGTLPIPVDVRIMATTSASLESRVADGSFMSHLYYRFGVFTIMLPPLRERADDIPLLAERFLARITRRDHRPTWLDDQAREILCRYPWPGNVRELESVLERAVHLSVDGVIRASDLPPIIRSGRILTGDSVQAEPVLSMDEAEREAIIRAGIACQGRVTEMAQQLGISRTTLWRKLRHFNLTTDAFK